MTQIYDEAGNASPSRSSQAGPCHVLQVRTKERDGYEAVQLGFLDKPAPPGQSQRTWSCCQARQQAVQEARAAAGVQAPDKAGC